MSSQETTRILLISGVDYLILLQILQNQVCVHLIVFGLRRNLSMNNNYRTQLVNNKVKVHLPVVFFHCCAAHMDSKRAGISD